MDETIETILNAARMGNEIQSPVVPALLCKLPSMIETMALDRINALERCIHNDFSNTVYLPGIYTS